MGCAVNPAVGYERMIGDDKLKPADAPRRIFVVGGGPAGMEAARAASLRGHRVVLAEAESRLGGALKLAARAPTRQSFRDLTTWLEDEIYRLGVDVRLSTYVEHDDILAEAPDAVILAAGSTPRMDGVQISNPGEPIEGFSGLRVVSSHDIFTMADRDWGKNAVVVDDLGHYEAVAVADHLQSRGMAVTYVSRHAAFAPLVETALMTEPALQRLSRGAFDLHLRARVLSAGNEGVRIAPTYLPPSRENTQLVAADVVIFVSANHANRDLYEPLREGGMDVHIVGDANAPRSLQPAIREGHLAGARV